MSDSPASTPPKPKPGSLRDRIAAFENKAVANTVPDRPPPRPKPGGFANWKPKQPSPPTSPGASTASGTGSSNLDAAGGVENVSRGGPGGMNAADAKESITRAGGSLKERMAALQGRGGFGAPAAPSVPAPKPAVERPKWKPPPQVVTQPAVSEDDDELNKLQEGTSEETEGSTVKSNPPFIKSPPLIPKSPPPIIRSPPSILEDDALRVSEEGEDPQEDAEGAKVEPVQVDEEEEERQRRAAIAARMAKLGGARIGMGPPIYGRPAVPQPIKSPPAAALEPEAGAPKVEQEASTELTEDAPDTSPRPPTAMPMAAIPKRAAPPRRKPAKTTSIGTVTSPEASPVPPTADAPAAVEESAALIDDVTTAGDEKIVVEPDTVEAHDPEPETAEISEEKPEEVVEEPPVKEEEEDDEEARKKRVAEKLAKMGGINPFALPSVRRPSTGSTASAEGAAVSPPSSSPVLTRKPTLPGSPRPIPTDKPSALRRASGGSAKSFDAPSGTDITRRASVGSVASVRSTTEVTGVGRRASVGSVRSIPKQEGIQEVQGIVEEPESIVPDDDASIHRKMESNEPEAAKDENDERNTHDSHEDEMHDEDIQSDERTNNDEDNEDFETTPQPPPRVPHVTSSLPQQGGTRGRVDPGDVVDAITRTEVPLPPRIVPASRDHSIDRDRLSGPAPPRRIVPQTPEKSARDFGDHDTSTSEAEGTGGDEEDSELAQSTLFIPPPIVAGQALRTILSAEVDDGEESEPPLRVPPPPDSARLSVSETRGRRGAYEDTDDESNASGVALPVRLNVASSEDTSEATKPNRPLPPPPQSAQSAPTPPTPAEQDSSSEYGDEQEHGEEHVMEERVLRTRPLSDDLSQSISSSVADLTENIPLIVPLRLAEGGAVRHAPVRSVPPPPRLPLTPSSPSSSSRPQRYEEEEDEEKEVLGEDEGDPIDPAFYSPSQRASYVPGGELEQAHAQAMAQVSQGSLSPSSAVMRSPPPVPLSPPISASISTVEPREQEQTKSEDEEEKGRKQTIAERMARLGGIKFGTSGLSGRPPVLVPPPRKASSDEPAGAGANEGQDEEPGHEKVGLIRERVESSGGDDNQDEDEEEERARRERIAAKLAGMGGMRIGMMPMAVPPRQSRVLGSELEQSSPPAPALPTMLPTIKGSDASESGTSEDGVKVEVEESEIEEVGYEEAKGESEEGSGEEVPPPPPPRIPNRRGTGTSVSSSATATSPTSPATRPPVPVPGPFRRASTQSTRSTKKSQQPSEYVLVDEPRAINEGVESDAGEEEGVPPPPPVRLPHRAPPPNRTAPSVPPAVSLGDSISSQWELPAIPSSSLGGDLSASWSEALVDEHQQAPPPPPPPHQSAPVPVPPPASRLPEALHLNADELMAVWGRVGVQICEVATTMHDHSKKTLIGDGTYRGFVDAVLREVPNAAKSQSKQIPYGYLVYLQNGGQVQKRASEIMPGDVAEIVDARFKGHKGLGGYQQHVGTGVEGGEGGGPVFGVICEFEPKKSKVRVFQANQHVGQQTVESVSYRLDDLKSGLVKVYRVLEA